MIVLTCLLPAALAAAESAGDGYVEGQTGISFPAAIGSLRRHGVESFADRDPRLGTMIRYTKGESCRGDVSVYNLGLAQISSDPEAPAIVRQLQEALGDIRFYERRGDYQDVKLSRIEVVNLGGLGSPVARRAVISYRERGSRQQSYLYITGYKNHFVKLRFTFAEQVRGQCDPALRELSKWLSLVLRNKRSV